MSSPALSQLEAIEALDRRLQQALGEQRWEAAHAALAQLHAELQGLFRHHPPATLDTTAAATLRRIEQDIRHAAIELTDVRAGLRDELRSFRGRRQAAAAYRQQG